MSENSPKKIKVFKKKPQNAPVSPAVETPEEDIVLPAETLMTTRLPKTTSLNGC